MISGSLASPNPPEGGEPGEHYTRPDGWRPPAARQASEIFFDDIFQGGILQGQIGIHSLETAVLVFKFLQPPHVRRLYAAIFGLPLVVGGGADAVFPPDLVDGATGIGIFQNRHDVGFGDLRLTHGTLPARVALVQYVLLFAVYNCGELTNVRYWNECYFGEYLLTFSRY